MDNSKIEKAKIFASTSKIPRRAVKPLNETKAVASRIPMIKNTVKSSNERCSNLSKYVAKPVIGNTDRRLPNSAVQHGNKIVTESSLKTVKKPTAESTNENKKVCEIKNQNNKSSKSSNRRLTINHSMPKAPTGCNKNISNQRLPNYRKIEAKMPVSIETRKKRQTINVKQQTTKCNYKETKFEKECIFPKNPKPKNVFFKSIQDGYKPCKDATLKSKSSVQANNDKNLNEEFNHFSQQNVEFVADEKYRHQILSGKELTPVKKPLDKVKCSSIYERPSLYKSSQTPFDINTALKRLEDEGRRISMMKSNNTHPDLLPSASKYKRESLFKSAQKPFDINAAIKRLEEEGRRNSMMKMGALSSSSQLAMKNHQPSILKAIENVDHASGNCRVSIIKSNPLHGTSPHLERNHTNLSAKDTFLKRLEELQMKRKAKSSKKVTFNLETSGSSGNVFKPDTYKTKDIKKHPTDNSVKNDLLTSKLVHKTPASEPHLSTEPPHQLKRDLTTSHYNAMLLRICGHSSTISAQGRANSQLHENTTPSKQMQSDICSHKPTPASSLKTPTEKDFTLPSTPTLKACGKESPSLALSPVEKMSASTYSAISQTVVPNFQTYKRSTSSIMASSALRSSLYLSRSQAIAESGLRRNTLSRLCTPIPVSFYPHTNENNEISPEFLGRRTSCIVANAPISTPMVLRNLAESFEETLSPVIPDTLAPVCQRLDFDEIEKETNDDDAPQDCDSSNELQKRPAQNIFRCINIIDQLTDQECCEILENASFSVIFERRLFNPVAQILSHGDDMHFIPLKLA